MLPELECPYPTIQGQFKKLLESIGTKLKKYQHRSGGWAEHDSEGKILHQELAKNLKRIKQNQLPTASTFQNRFPNNTKH